RLDTRTALETVDALDHRNPRLLHYLFGDSPAGDVLRREPQELPEVTIKQECERVGVTRGKGFGQYAVVGEVEPGHLRIVERSRHPVQCARGGIRFTHT